MSSRIRRSVAFFFFAVGCSQKQILHLIHLLVQDLFKGQGREGEGGDIIFSWHDILEPHFTQSLHCWGIFCVHSFHVSCQRYFLCSCIRLSNKLMVFQIHSAAVQSAGSVTAHIWWNLRADKWGAGFQCCEACGAQFSWACPGRAPFFSCQVAWVQVCGGAAQSASSD